MRPFPPDLAALTVGGKPALARCLSALETVPDDPALLALLEAAWQEPRGIAIGLTGPPGVGKSSLCSALIAEMRARGQTVAVIAVDPSSRRSGGALLGDRARIETDPEDAGVFIRSMAARRRLGGLADLTFPALVLLRACFDRVLVETVGVGQSETEIADCADLVILCVQPASGDGLQFIKAGIMETPDLVLVTKADLGAPARRAVADVRGALSIAGADADIALVSAHSGKGVAAAVDLVDARLARPAFLAALPDRRRAQADSWVESRLLESVGSLGLAAITPRPRSGGAPFGPVAAMIERVRTALHQSIKNA
ncbi:MAG TPA: P-loop NTPase fold protein [Amaricoccus sp.]|nr:P-loop NTPase fold protein [Amaricoccus sp.]